MQREEGWRECVARTVATGSCIDLGGRNGSTLVDSTADEALSTVMTSTQFVPAIGGTVVPLHPPPLRMHCPCDCGRGGCS